MSARFEYCTVLHVGNPTGTHNAQRCTARSSIDITTSSGRRCQNAVLLFHREWCGGRGKSDRGSKDKTSFVLRRFINTVGCPLSFTHSLCIDVLCIATLHTNVCFLSVQFTFVQSLALGQNRLSTRRSRYSLDNRCGAEC